MIGSAPEEQKEQIWGMVSAMLMSGQIDALRPLARSKSLFNSVPASMAQATIDRLINHNSWVQKEVGCTAAATIGAPVLEGALGEKIKDRILKLINDSDSDVKQQQKQSFPSTQ